MTALESITVLDVVVLLLVLHGVAVVVAVVLYGEGQSKATSLWVYMEPRVFAGLFVAVALTWWAVVAVGPREGAYFRSLAGGPVLSLGFGVVLLSAGASNALLLARTLSARLRAGPPAGGETIAVSGRAEPVEGTIETPFSGLEALCTQATVKAYEPSWPHSAWAEHDEHVQHRRFAVEGRHGRVLVDPAAARWRLPETFEATVDEDDRLPERVASGLGSTPALEVPTSPKIGFAVEDTKFLERTLESGRQVLVVGEVSMEAGSAVVADGDPFVVSVGDPWLVHASVVAWTVLGSSLGAWLLLGGFRSLARLVGLA